MDFYEELQKNQESFKQEYEEDKIIRASIKATVTKQDLIDTFNKKYLVGVYHLGMKNMLDYLNGN